jgi:7-cyano-7-deazaguanine tRNA-ribosyltransferase
MFEIRAKDGLGRIGRLEIEGKSVETPLLMPVINPHRSEIPPKEIQKDYGADMIITNAFILYESSLKEKAIKKGIHSFLDFDGIIETDSGSFQLMTYGSISISNEEILHFQNQINSDVCTFLDIPTVPESSFEEAAHDLTITLERARQALDLKKSALNGTLQGGSHLSLRKKAAQEMAAYGFDIYPIGAVVPFLMKYNFSPLADIILTCKSHLPLNAPVHLFGAGHPLILSFAVLLGCDLFDSAAYILYAKGHRYLTPFGTRTLEDLQYFPCSCPQCSSTDPETVTQLPEDEKIHFLLRHNLHCTFSEIRKIKQAIHEGSLWELVESRIRNHPHLLEAYRVIERYTDFIETCEPFTKRSGFLYTGEETALRPICSRVKKRIENMSGPTFTHPIFGEVPLSLSQTYPFHTDETFPLSESQLITDIARYQFGPYSTSLFDDVTISHGRTGKVRHVSREDVLLATLRPMDGLFVLTLEGAHRLHSLVPPPRRRVIADEEAVPFIKEGKDLFAKFVVSIDASLRAYEEVFITDEKDTLLGVGKLLLSPEEALSFTRGVAVQCRRGVHALHTIDIE